jgi:DNA-binding transcriptional ArsR family regulator
MQKKPNDKSAKGSLATRLLCALNHPLRRQIINALVQEPASASTLSKTFGVPLSNVSYHLNEILWRECDLVKIVQRNQRRGAMETVFAVKPEVFVQAIDWPAVPEPLRSGLRGLALQNFQTAAIAALEADAGMPNETSVYMFRPAWIDRQGQREISAAIEQLLATVKTVEDRCAHLDPAELLNLIIGIAAFEAAPLPGVADE